MGACSIKIWRHSFRSGKLGLIVGDKIGLIDLDHPDKLVAKQNRINSKHDVSEIQFSLGKETLCAIASGNKVKLIKVKKNMFANFSFIRSIW